MAEHRIAAINHDKTQRSCTGGKSEEPLIGAKTVKQARGQNEHEEEGVDHHLVHHALRQHIDEISRQWNQQQKDEQQRCACGETRRTKDRRATAIQEKKAEQKIAQGNRL